MTKLLLLIISSLFLFVSCEVNENEATVFNIAYTDPLVGTECSLPPDGSVQDDAEMVKRCEDQQGCQVVLDNGNNYIGCVPIPESDPNAPSGGDSTPSDDETNKGGDGTSGGDSSSGGGDSSSGGDSTSDGNSSSGGDSSSDDASSDDDGLSEEQSNACSNPNKNHNHKVLVCHHNKGINDHVTICIAKKAWENAHQQNAHHSGLDYLGSCKNKDLN